MLLSTVHTNIKFIVLHYAAKFKLLAPEREQVGMGEKLFVTLTFFLQIYALVCSLQALSSGRVKARSALLMYSRCLLVLRVYVLL